SLKFVLVFQTLLYIPIALLAHPIATLFSSDPQVIEWLHLYILLLPLAYGPLGVVIIVATSLNAYHKPMASLTLNLCRLFLLMLPLAWLGAELFGVTGLLAALPLTNLVMGIGCYMLAKRLFSAPAPAKLSSV
ncbi:MAG: MATE family efflux transporter, partial [Shewanella sp.]